MVVNLLGIRHHGPGSARSVRTALESLEPDAVLVELPVDVEPALRWIGDPGLEPPVAVLGWCVADPSRAAFAPLAVFSPEWQAIEWANARGVPVAAIDLPLAVTLAAEHAHHDGTELTEPGRLVGEAAPPDPLRMLAAAAGEVEPERWWEDVIEHRGDGEPAFAAVHAAMAAARDGHVPTAREAQREAHMRRAIRQTLRRGADRVAVVCGAWHVPALDVDAVTATADNAALRGLSRTKVGVAWVPWSHRRLAAATGYGAGVDSPGWYAHVFANPGPDGVARFFVATAHLLRANGHAASPDHLIAATRLADALATLRGRPRPGLAEVLDAAGTVMAAEATPGLVRRELVVGDVLGRVPAHAPQVPLARDLATQQRAVRLRPGDASRTVELDLRTSTGRRRSHLLHRLLAIGVPWGALEQGRGSSGTFRETWRVVWEPELSLRLVERSGYGTTVEAAAAAVLDERADRATELVELVAVLDRALLADLAVVVQPCVRRLEARAATDPDVGHLMDVVGPLAHAVRYGDVRATDVGSLRAVLDGLVVRILAGAVPAIVGGDDEAAEVAVERLAAVQAALAMLDHPARAHAFPAVLAQLAEHRLAHGSVQGRATRLLHDAGQWAVSRVEERLSRALSVATAPGDAAAFVEGFLAGSGTVLVHDGELRGIVDRWVASLGPDAFDRVVPMLRRTFGAFEPAERRQLMHLLSDVAAPAPPGFGADVDPARAAAVTVTVRLLLGLPPHEPLVASTMAIPPGAVHLGGDPP